MEKHEFKITINGPREKVWKVLWDDASYRKWTSVFAPGSCAKTDWKKGSEIQFLDEKNDGMISRVEENIPNEFMSIEHLGYVKNGVEDRESEEVKKWAGAHENYTLKSANGQTVLVVDMDIVDEYKDYFTNTWPKALEKVKELSEEH
ncbi:SRPBCC domain-containing protein [Chitinophaga filiformis]|uniref:Activator of Hsp90 ATPase homolog 1-like protein n=1 Tax=Chitinophaga filiformis TaxID=104663 RepID=A0A1G7LNF1_CHIFI|nr:SRPBCC domain-containing protein [Chitinophaga filiformis]SDF50911.1 Activator of Hsp90 ATPase homolog 1-like protein [Chitinophaga filiformis]